jgi:hypothetical protein
LAFKPERRIVNHLFVAGDGDRRHCGGPGFFANWSEYDRSNWSQYCETTRSGVGRMPFSRIAVDRVRSNSKDDRVPAATEPQSEENHRKLKRSIQQNDTVSVGKAPDQ